MFFGTLWSQHMISIYNSTENKKTDYHYDQVIYIHLMLSDIYKIRKNIRKNITWSLMICFLLLIFFLSKVSKISFEQFLPNSHFCNNAHATMSVYFPFKGPIKQYNCYILTYILHYYYKLMSTCWFNLTFLYLKGLCNHEK